jgi:hypothetical protein
MTPSEDPTTIGNLLMDAGIITPWQLSEGVVYAKQHSLRLGEALRHLGYISDEAVDSTLHLQKAKRATTASEAAEHTTNLIAYASERLDALGSRLDEFKDKADVVVRGLRSRRATLKT